MPLNTHAKGTIIFSIMMVLGSLWLSVSPVFDPPWEPWEPVVPIMEGLVAPLVSPYYRPLLIALTGLAAFWVWEGRRIGYLIALLQAIIGSGFTVFVTFANVINQTWLGAFTTLCASVPALLALWHAYQGYRLQGSAAYRKVAGLHDSQPITETH